MIVSVFFASIAAATGPINVTTPSSGWSAAADGGYVGISNKKANGVAFDYKTPAGRGSVAPGTETASQGCTGNVYHFLFAESGGGAPPASPAVFACQQAVQRAAVR